MSVRSAERSNGITEYYKIDLHRGLLGKSLGKFEYPSKRSIVEKKLKRLEEPSYMINPLDSI